MKDSLCYNFVRLQWTEILLKIFLEKAALFAATLPCQTMYAAAYACFS